MNRCILGFAFAVLLAGSTMSCGVVASKIIGSRSYRIPNEAMEPTIEAGSSVRARLTNGGYSPKLGDIVIFRWPESWSTQNREALHIGRVIGIPQSRVTCCDAAGHLTIDGNSLDEPYITANPASATNFDVTVPKDHLWIMGDNRDKSLDSRAHLDDLESGTIAVSNVEGVVSSAGAS